MALHNNTKVYPAQTSAHSTDDVHFPEVDIGNDKTDEQPKILDDDSRHRYMLTPSSPIRVGWDIFILVLLGFIFVAVPLGLAFGDRFERHMVEVDLVIDILFLVDVALNFRTGYPLSEDEDEIVTDPRKVAMRYLRGWCVIDIISCPSVFEYANLDMGSEFTAFKLLKGAKALKVLKMVKVLKLLRVNGLMGRYALEIEELMFRGSTQVRLKLVNLLALVGVAGHWLACMWLAVSNTTSDRRSWMNEYHDGRMDDDEEYAPFREWSMWDQYVGAFYFSVTTMTTVGFGDIVPSSTGERLFMILAMILGGGMYGFIIASLASVVTSLDMNQKTYFDKMDMIHSYMRHRQFPAELRHRVHRFFKKFFEMNSALDEKAILNDLPETLRNDVLYLLLDEAVRTNFLFRGHPKAAVSKLALVFKHSEIDGINSGAVVRRGEWGSIMFVITGGTAECYRPRQEEKAVAALEEASKEEEEEEVDALPGEGSGSVLVNQSQEESKDEGEDGDHVEDGSNNKKKNSEGGGDEEGKGLLMSTFIASPVGPPPSMNSTRKAGSAARLFSASQATGSVVGANIVEPPTRFGPPRQIMAQALAGESDHHKSVAGGAPDRSGWHNGSGPEMFLLGAPPPTALRTLLPKITSGQDYYTREESRESATTRGSISMSGSGNSSSMVKRNASEQSVGSEITEGEEDGDDEDFEQTEKQEGGDEAGDEDQGKKDRGTKDGGARKETKKKAAAAMTTAAIVKKGIPNSKKKKKSMHVSEMEQDDVSITSSTSSNKSLKGKKKSEKEETSFTSSQSSTDPLRDKNLSGSSLESPTGNKAASSWVFGAHTAGMLTAGLMRTLGQNHSQSNSGEEDDKKNPSGEDNEDNEDGSEEGDLGELHCVLEAGDSFGELVAFGLEDQYNATVMASPGVILELLVATTADIYACFAGDETLWEELRQRAKDHSVRPPPPFVPVPHPSTSQLRERHHRQQSKMSLRSLSTTMGATGAMTGADDLVPLKKRVTVLGENGSGLGAFDPNSLASSMMPSPEVALLLRRQWHIDNKSGSLSFGPAENGEDEAGEPCDGGGGSYSMDSGSQWWREAINATSVDESESPSGNSTMSFDWRTIFGGKDKTKSENLSGTNLGGKLTTVVAATAGSTNPCPQVSTLTKKHQSFKEKSGGHQSFKEKSVGHQSFKEKSGGHQSFKEKSGGSLFSTPILSKEPSHHHHHEHGSGILKDSWESEHGCVGGNVGGNGRCHSGGSLGLASAAAAAGGCGGGLGSFVSSNKGRASVAQQMVLELGVGGGGGFTDGFRRESRVKSEAAAYAAYAAAAAASGGGSPGGSRRQSNGLGSISKRRPSMAQLHVQQNVQMQGVGGSGGGGGLSLGMVGGSTTKGGGSSNLPSDFADNVFDVLHRTQSDLKNMAEMQRLTLARLEHNEATLQRLEDAIDGFADLKHLLLERLPKPAKLKPETELAYEPRDDDMRDDTKNQTV